MTGVAQQTDSGPKRYRIRIIMPAYPAFNIYSRIARITTALGPVSVATSVHDVAGWDVEVIDENNYQRSGPKDDSGMPDHAALQKMRPADMVGFYGGLTSTIPRLYELARFYSGLGIPTIAGGQHFVSETVPDALVNGVDTVVLGEGEETIKELLLAHQGRLRREDIKGIAFLDGGRVVQTAPREPLKQFDQLPIPDFSLVRYAKISLYPVGRVRGCGMDCEFCTVKGKARIARPERLLEQISSLYDTYGARYFFIVDDLFGQDRLETLRLCRLLKEFQQRIKHRLDLVVQIRLDKAKDAELLKAMREAGVTMVAVGFESPIREELEAMDKRLKPEEMISLARIFHKAGFLVHGMFIFGYPEAGEKNFRMPAAERVQHFRKFIKKAWLDTVQVLLPVPLPGTEFTRRLRAQNRIFPKDLIGWEYYDGNFPVIMPDAPMTPEEMQTSIQTIMGRFYRFRYMFLVGLQVLCFPVLFFYLFNLRAGWGRWYRVWRNSITRFGGWLILRRWFSKFRQDNFTEKLVQAKRFLRQSSHSVSSHEHFRSDRTVFQ